MNIPMKRFENEIPDTDEGDLYIDFKGLNKVIEEWNISPQEAMTAYTDIVCEKVSDLIDNSYIHQEMDFLVNWIEVPLNNIHEFISYKFPQNIEWIIDWLVYESWFLSETFSYVFIDLINKGNDEFKKKWKSNSYDIKILSNDKQIKTLKFDLNNTKNNQEKAALIKYIIDELKVCYLENKVFSVDFIENK